MHLFCCVKFTLIRNNRRQFCNYWGMYDKCNVLTVISMNLDWNHAPQHPKNATTNVTPPIIKNTVSAEAKLYCGTKLASPELANRSQSTAPSIPHADNC